MRVIGDDFIFQGIQDLRGPCLCIADIGLHGADESLGSGDQKIKRLAKQDLTTLLIQAKDSTSGALAKKIAR